MVKDCDNQYFKLSSQYVEHKQNICMHMCLVFFFFLSRELNILLHSRSFDKFLFGLQLPEPLSHKSSLAI